MRSPANIRSFRSALLNWFRKIQRPLPWREGYQPYQVWISEIMLQQTQVDTMLPYFQRWMERFPDVGSVARAPEAAILKAWEGLGYYTRARNLKSAAMEMVARHKGDVPADYAALLALPGIGPYTAGAIASIAFQLPHAVVDGNISRVLSRLFVLEKSPLTSEGRAEVWRLSGQLLDRENPRDFNQAMMELGALVCRSRQPECPACPLKEHCQAHEEGLAEAYPRNRPRQKRPLVRGVMMMALDHNRFLLRHRPSKGLWGGLWEFPWVELKEKEGRTGALNRLRSVSGGIKSSGARAGSPRRLGLLSHGLTHFQLELDCFLLEIHQDQWSPPEGQEHRWVDKKALAGLPLARINHQALALLDQERDEKNNG